jgi:hypothetical protein
VASSIRFAGKVGAWLLTPAARLVTHRQQRLDDPEHEARDGDVCNLRHLRVDEQRAFSAFVALS